MQKTRTGCLTTLRWAAGASRPAPRAAPVELLLGIPGSPSFIPGACANTTISVPWVGCRAHSDRCVEWGELKFRGGREPTGQPPPLPAGSLHPAGLHQRLPRRHAHAAHAGAAAPRRRRHPRCHAARVCGVCLQQPRACAAIHGQRQRRRAHQAGALHAAKRRSSPPALLCSVNEGRFPLFATGPPLPPPLQAEGSRAGHCAAVWRRAHHHPPHRRAAHGPPV